MGGKEVTGYMIVLYPRAGKGRRTNKYSKTFYLQSICIEHNPINNSIDTTIEISDKRGDAAFFGESFEYVTKIANNINENYKNYNAVVEPSSVIRYL
jgi:hypothetical protein